MSRGERVVGILAGLLVGLAAVIGFVLLGGEQAIDSPLLDHPAEGPGAHRLRGLDLELIGYGVARTIASRRPAAIRFTASRLGDFPLVVASSHIGVGTIEVKRAGG